MGFRGLGFRGSGFILSFRDFRGYVCEAGSVFKTLPLPFPGRVVAGWLQKGNPWVRSLGFTSLTFR